ncbi:Aminomethyltransferase [Beijerinckiaceae bacterium RH AL1]|nr:aminomethyltransferase family protein [Beijerinckiaceae bacterium]VVB49370.1 Aminomethyltransferase [Beijerinckiaceae bacterium RH CH11]VVB49450.1 Aminomethyltransferase [Beijerinckiaceae bacterium RH AL8]VVC56868.1 Aminomethyltransferase [Beijerinckiaceae bacterium RH AL1]
MSIMSWRRSPLADRHRALGSSLEDWNGMETAWTYASDLADEHEAIRTKAGVMDVSGLRKFHLVGPHSHQVLQHTTTRDVRKLYPGRSVYAAILNDGGKFTDDCILYRTGPNAWMVVIGSGGGHAMLASELAGKNVALLFDDDLQDISLQGPLAVDYLEKHVPGIRQLKYFHHMQTQLFGKAVMISRTGYTGERGYEIFCRAEDAPAIWDQIVSEGKAMGIIPCSFTALDWLRTESYLLFYPYDNSQMYPLENEPAGDTLWELGLDFTVSPNKTGFRGAEEHYRLKGKERFKIFGVLADSDKALEPGDKLYRRGTGEEVGVVTCAMYSRLTKRSMAIARMAVDVAKEGTPLEVKGANVQCAAIAHPINFDDPEKKKRTAA